MGQQIGTPPIAVPSPTQIPSGMMNLSGPMSNLTSGVQYKCLLDTIPAGYTDGIEDTVNNRIIIPTAGYYNVVGHVTFYNVVADKTYEAWLRLNASHIDFTRNWQHASITGAGEDVTCWTIFPHLRCLVNDYIDLYCQQNSGVDTVHVNDACTYLAVQRVR